MKTSKGLTPVDTTGSLLSPLCFEMKQSLGEAALSWYIFGFNVLPIQPGTKRPAVKWSWANDLSPAKIGSHWKAHPDHEVGFIVGDHLVVLDADSSESVAALYDAERRHGVEPALVVSTKRGEHHYFRRDATAIVSSASHCTRDFPERIDIKTGRSMVILAPSTGKKIVKLGPNLRHANDLTVAPQSLIDALTHRTSRPVKPAALNDPRQTVALAPPSPAVLRACLNCLDPDMPYDLWFRVAAALHHCTAGAEDGFALFDEWSSKGRKYKGLADTRRQWRRLRSDLQRPFTFAKLRRMVEEVGHDWMEVCADAEDGFKVVGEGE